MKSNPVSAETLEPYDTVSPARLGLVENVVSSELDASEIDVSAGEAAGGAVPRARGQRIVALTILVVLGAAVVAGVLALVFGFYS